VGHQPSILTTYEKSPTSLKAKEQVSHPSP
jgi:hypothetical protein